MSGAKPGNDVSNASLAQQWQDAMRTDTILSPRVVIPIVVVGLLLWQLAGLANRNAALGDRVDTLQTAFSQQLADTNAKLADAIKALQDREDARIDKLAASVTAATGNAGDAKAASESVKASMPALEGTAKAVQNEIHAAAVDLNAVKENVIKLSADVENLKSISAKTATGVTDIGGRLQDHASGMTATMSEAFGKQSKDFQDAIKALGPVGLDRCSVISAKDIALAVPVEGDAAAAGNAGAKIYVLSPGADAPK